jgi:RNA polymerase sigma-70 factor (ECF subfamily)
MRSLAPPELSDEVLQDVMLVLWQRAAQVPPHVPLIAWLSGVARHKALKARARMGTPAVVPTAPESLDYEEPEAVALRREHLLMLTAALDRLPRSERMALELLAYQECSPQEIAMQTGVPVSTVRTWVSRARQRLRAYVSVI